MGRTKRNKKTKRIKRLRPSVNKSASPKKTYSFKSLSSILKRSWKVIVGLGVIVGLVVGIKTLFLNDKTAPISFEQPRFSEDVNELTVTLGGMNFTYNRSTLEKGPKEPLISAEFKPVKVYLDNGQLYADVTVLGGSGLPPLKIRKNVVYGKPNQWDINYNETALEIVTKQHKPVYQFIYKSPSKIVINGLFPLPSGLLVATEKSSILNPTGRTIFSLDPIFKYPSWKYKGQYKEE